MPSRRTRVRSVIAAFLASGGVLLVSCQSDSVGPHPTDLVELQFDVSGPDPVWIGAGDIASCGNDNDEATAVVIDSLLLEHPQATVFAAGDNVYEDGTAQEYADCYDPTWGRFLDRTWAVLGNHEYQVGDATASYDYFGSRVGPRGQGYYSLDVGDWHIVMLNTGDENFVPYGAGSAQEQWLRADLAATTKACIMGVFHHARFYSPDVGEVESYKEDQRPEALWNALEDAGASLVVAGHRHRYERWAPVDRNANIDHTAGIRQIVAGTGGKSMSGLPLLSPAPQAESVGVDNGYGVVKLTLRPGAYDWEYVPIAGVTFTDSGSAACVGGFPNADFTWEEGPLLGVDFTDTSTDSDGTIVSWSWDFGDASPTSSAQNPSHTYASAGTYSVTLTVTDDNGLSGATTKSVTVGPRPPSADFTWQTVALQTNFTDTSTDSDGTIVGWLWDFGDSSPTSSAQNPSHGYAAAGTY
ncbi:MAG: PKD domain-containing protein, partial [Gemmatimonadetes bacterium]|nr:PKD domain-containing protein [Gemmatimonadota bacterium]